LVIDPVNLALAFVAGLLAGVAANWAANTLPGPREAEEVPQLAAFPRGFLQSIFAPRRGDGRTLRAPLLELAMIAAFVLLASKTHAWQAQGDALRTLVFWLYAWFLLTVLVIDIEHRLVLNAMTAPAAVIALGASFLPGTPTPVDALIGGAVGFGLFFVIALVGRGAMGMGDVKLAGVIGLMVGYPLVLPALLAGIILGGLAAAFLLITKRATRKTAIAYAPYLCLGALAILLLMA
jgi:leader peptidase (prepilin peptidase)/N-methyltransferase